MQTKGVAMPGEYNMEDAQRILDSSSAEAQGLLGNVAQVEDLLGQAQAQLANLPDTIVGAASNVPVMVEMIKGYITQEYTVVSPKVVASVLGALLYLVKGKDIIPDSLPIVGLVDDLAVLTLALKINEPELEAFKTWRDAGKPPVV